MAYTDPDPYLINATPLGTMAWRISAIESPAPVVRDTGIVIPQSHGELDPSADPAGPRRIYGPGQIKLTGWVLGVDPATGAFTGTGLTPYLARCSELVKLLSAPRLAVQHQRPDGHRFADGYRVSAIAPAREPASPWFGRWEVTIKIPGSFWRAAAAVTASGTVATGGTISLATFAGAEAPIGDGVVTFGPSTNPRLTLGGGWVQYGGVIAAGRQVAIDCATWTLGIGSGSAWTPDPTLLSYSPGPSWFELDPTISPLQATLTHTGGGTALASFAGKLKFMTS